MSAVLIPLPFDENLVFLVILKEASCSLTMWLLMLQMVPMTMLGLLALPLVAGWGRHNWVSSLGASGIRHRPIKRSRPVTFMVYGYFCYTSRLFTL